MLDILIVDDEAEIREMLKMRLNSLYDCKAIAVSSVENALSLCTHRSFNLIFFDYRFTGVIDGFALLYDLKRKNSAAVTIMMSAFMFNMREVEEKGYNIKPDEFLFKPFPDGAIDELMQKYFPDSKKANNSSG